MATLEKLVKSLSCLRAMAAPSQNLDSNKKRDKLYHCNVIVEAMCNPAIRVAANFDELLRDSFELLFLLCDDDEADVRMFADECLNRIIRSMIDGNAIKILVQLHKEIRNNGPARMLKAALWRFSALCHHIKQVKGKAYVTNIVPCLITFAERKEDFVLEVVCKALPKIMEALGSFTSDTDIRGLLKAFMRNLASVTPVHRRTAAACIHTICMNSRKPLVFVLYVMNTLLDILIPVSEDQTASVILGALGCLRVLIPCLKLTNQEQELQGSFGIKKDAADTLFDVTKVVNIYELCLYYVCNADHNVVNAALETLNVLLQTASEDLIDVLISPEGIQKSRIFSSDARIKRRSLSQMSVATTIAAGDESALAEGEATDAININIQQWIEESKLAGAKEPTNAATAKLNQLNLEDSGKETMDNFVPIGESSFSAMYLDNAESSDNLAENTLTEVNLDSRTLKISDLDVPERTSGDSSPQTLAPDTAFKIVDVGEFTDSDVALVHCARLLCKSFLLTGSSGHLIPDKKVRVSVKSLSLNCLASVLYLHPRALLLQLDKGSRFEETDQKIADILLYASHDDPQLRGALRVVLSNFIYSSLLLSGREFGDWIERNSEGSNLLSLKCLINIIDEGLKDESSICSRQSLSAVGQFIRPMAESAESHLLLPLLNSLFFMVQNPYWLVKVKLVEVLSEIDFVTMHYLTGNSGFQDKVVSNALFALLSDEDQRVRHATALAIIKILPSLYYQEDKQICGTVITKAISYQKQFVSDLFDISHEMKIVKPPILHSVPFPFDHLDRKSCDDTEKTLSRIVSFLTGSLIVSSSKPLTNGCCETLSMLASKYPPTVYGKAWSCPKADSKQSKTMSSEYTSGLFNATISLMTTSNYAYDISCLQWLMNLSGMLFAGISCNGMRVDRSEEQKQELWSMFVNKRNSESVESLLSHVMKVLNVFYHIVEDLAPSQPTAVKPILPNLASASNLSPIKKRSKSDVTDRKVSPAKSSSVFFGDKEEKTDKKIEGPKVNAMGYFANIPHYMKIYDVLKAAHRNYKVSLDEEASENLLKLLSSSLHTMSLVLEIATCAESGRLADELLQYFQSVVSLEPTKTIACVQQLLKSISGTNLVHVHNDALLHVDALPRKITKQCKLDLFYNISQSSYHRLNDFIVFLSDFYNVRPKGPVDEDSSMGFFYLKHMSPIKSVPRGVDKVTLSNYIRLFEPMVLKALKLYLMTTNVRLQCSVLQLLSLLIRFKVSYSSLDSDQIFVAYILNQFEFIEGGQVRCADELLSKMFHFLIQLTYEKQNAKSIVNVPKIIQLCDGLMASGQPAATHCIPALIPVIKDVFLIRNQTRADEQDFKEFETTKEVLFAMLLRLVEHHEVLDLLALIIGESRNRKSTEDVWTKRSQQAFDCILPALVQRKIRLESKEAQISLQRLITILDPNVLLPKSLLSTLFVSPPNLTDSEVNFNRWLGMVLTVLLILIEVREDKVLAQMDQMLADIPPQSIFEAVNTITDPLHVSGSSSKIFDGITTDQILARFIFRVIKAAVQKLLQIIRSYKSCSKYLAEQISVVLFFCLHMFQSGNYNRTAKAAGCLLANREMLQMDETIEAFDKISFFFPSLAFEWCDLLSVLNYSDKTFWSSVLQNYSNSRYSINIKIVKTGVLVSFCDYLCENSSDSKLLEWFISNYTCDMIWLFDETPISELISSIHRNPEMSRLFIQKMTDNCSNTEPSFLDKFLKAVEHAHVSQSGAVLMLLVPKLSCRQLSVSRLVASSLSRRLEIILTLSSEEVNEQLTKADIRTVLDHLIETRLAKKLENIVSLLCKISVKYFNCQPLESSQDEILDPAAGIIDKNWYIQQVEGCCLNQNAGSIECAELLSSLDYDDLIRIMSCANFNRDILTHCIHYGTRLCVEKQMEMNKCPILMAAVLAMFEDVERLKEKLPKPHQVFQPVGRESLPSELKYSQSLEAVFSAEPAFWPSLRASQTAIAEYLELIQSAVPAAQIPLDQFENLAKVGVLCLEALAAGGNASPDVVDRSLRCAAAVLQQRQLCSILGLDSHASWLCSAVNCLFGLVQRLLLGRRPLPDLLPQGLALALASPETMPAGHACHQLAVLVAWLQRCQAAGAADLPAFLAGSVRSIVVALARLPLVNSYILTPPSAWVNDLDARLMGPFNTQVPPLPIQILQEAEVLEEFVFRINLIGWTSRPQFEETWMCLLGVLSSTPDESNALEGEGLGMLHASSVAVKAITSLLLQTLLVPCPGYPGVSHLIHVPRNREIPSSNASLKKLRVVQEKLCWKYREYSKLVPITRQLGHVFDRANLEKVLQIHSYASSQLSVEHLWIAAKIVENSELSYAKKVHSTWESQLADSGIDLNSCIQFLLDLFSLWTKPQNNTPLKLLLEIFRSVLVISDLFTEKSQFQWMLNACLELAKVHPVEDDVLQQYLVLGACKATSVLSPELEVYENVKKLLQANLKSGFMPCQMACIHGMLYLLEGSIMGSTVIGGISDETQLIHSLAVDYIQSNINPQNGFGNTFSEEHELLVWALVFYLLENIDEQYTDTDAVPSILQAIFNVLSQTISVRLAQYCVLMQGLERLIVKKSLSNKLVEQVIKLAVEKLKNPNPNYMLPALQLFLTCLYTDADAQLESTEALNGIVESDPDALVKNIEHISSIFNRIRKGYPFEVEILCSVLPNLLNDFFPPSEILNKVIGEFLSPHQPHPRVLSRVVFQVFERACEHSQLLLIQDWVVYNLSNFTQSLPIGMATWCLTCFFISASTNRHLRSLFPYVQSRIGRYEAADRKMLRIAGANFYRSLTNETQRQDFLATFSKVQHQEGTPYADLIASLV